MFAEYLDGLRDLAEARMEESSRATIHRLTGDTVKDGRGLDVPEWSATPDVPCRIADGSSGSGQSRTLDIGGLDITVSVRTAHFPHGTDVRNGDLIEITSGDTVGEVFRVVEGEPADQQTARRVPVVGADRPEEWS